MFGTAVRAIRGATTVPADHPDDIRKACCALFSAMVERNEIAHDDLISLTVTVTADLTSMFAAQAFREECDLGDVPLIGALEAPVEAGLERAIRVLAHVNTTISRADIVHVFQGEAARLRPDLDELS